MDVAPLPMSDAGSISCPLASKVRSLKVGCSESQCDAGLPLKGGPLLHQFGSARSLPPVSDHQGFPPSGRNSRSPDFSNPGPDKRVRSEPQSRLRSNLGNEWCLVGAALDLSIRKAR